MTPPLYRDLCRVSERPLLPTVPLITSTRSYFITALAHIANRTYITFVDLVGRLDFHFLIARVYIDDQGDEI